MLVPNGYENAGRVIERLLAGPARNGCTRTRCHLETQIVSDAVHPSRDTSWAMQDRIKTGDWPCAAQLYAVGHENLTRHCS